MNLATIIGAAGLIALSGCTPSTNQENEAAPQEAPKAPQETPSAPPAAASAPAAPSYQAPAPQPPKRQLEEPKQPIAPTSAEAAGQLIQKYGALVEQKRWAEAARLWGQAQQASAFARRLKDNRETHLEIGDLSPVEGAAGSLYVSMPVTFYGRDQAGKEFRMPATIVVRRVNDVPGSTEEQRRWHIDHVEVRPRA